MNLSTGWCVLFSVFSFRATFSGSHYRFPIITVDFI